jgi:hypothetical protein
MQIVMRDPGFPDLLSNRESEFPVRESREFGSEATGEAASTRLCGEIGAVALAGNGNYPFLGRLGQWRS